jgi:S1-C subfamily serine protease
MTDTLRRLRDGVASRTDQPTDQPTDSPPPIYPTTSSSPVGLLCQSVTAETAGNLGLDRARGMVVLGVTSGSAAAAAGLRQKDVILKINGAEVSDLSALRGIAGEVAMNKTVPVEILRHGSQQVVQLQVSQLRR